MAAEKVKQFLSNRSFANDGISYYLSTIFNLCSSTLDRKKYGFRNNDIHASSGQD
jgi:hypothetical protein